MLDHHIQRSIVYHLALAQKLKFTELKPDVLDNKLFTYHLKKVISAGFVVKTEDGFYKLTPEGRRLGAHILDNTEALFDRAYSVLFLAIQRKRDGAWLLYRRKTHPLLDKVGFMHTAPNASDLIVETAHKACLEKTGINATFKVAGSGFFRIYDAKKLESFTNFTLLFSEDAQGEIAQNDAHAEYFWAGSIDTHREDLLPNMPTLLKNLELKTTFFIEETIQI